MPTNVTVDSKPSPSSWRSAIRGNVLMMSLVSFFTDASSEMIFPLLPVFLTGLVPLSTAAIYLGIMQGISEATSSLLKVFSGRISDSLGKRKLLVIIGYGISTLFRPLIAIAASGWHIVAFRFADRLGKGIRTSPRDALISYSVGPNLRGLAFGFHRAMDHAGAVVGPVLAALILYAFLGEGLWLGHSGQANDQQMHALRWLFALALIPGLAAMITLIVKVREITPTTPAPDQHQLHESLSPRHKLPRKFRHFVAIAALFALGNSSDLFLLLLAKTRFSLDMMSLLALWLVLHLSKVVFSPLGGILSDKLGRRPLIIAGWTIYALVYLGFALTTQPWQFWSLFIVYGLYYGFTEGVEKALVADFVPAGLRGRAYGLYHGAVGLAALPASLIFGVFWKFLGAPLAFGIGAALAALAAILLSVFLMGKPKGQPAA